MSAINVWTSAGEWSSPIRGLDKVHLIKAVCRAAAVNPDEDGIMVIDPDLASRIELNNCEIDYKRRISCFCDEDTGKIESYDIEHFPEDLDDATTFKVPLSVLVTLQEKDPILSAMYGKIIAEAKAPASPSKDYCLLLKFGKE